MKITNSETIKMEVNDVLGMEAINTVQNMLNDICCNLGELSAYDLINGYNVISNEDINTAMMVIDSLLITNNLEWTVKRKK